MKKTILYIFILLFSNITNAQDVEKVNFSTRTPQSTIKTFHSFLSKNNYNPEKASYVLNGHFSQTKKNTLTVRLSLLLKRYGRLKIDNIPNERRYKDDNGDYKYVLFSRHKDVYLERVRGKWLFSSETVGKIDQLYHDELKKNFKVKSKNVLVGVNKVDSLKGKFSMKTPYQTLYSHILFSKDSTFRPDYLEKMIDDGGKLNKAERVEKMIKIFQYYLGANQKWIHLDDVPNEANYIDTASGKHIFIINPNIPELYLEKVGRNWKYSKTTEEMIDELHESVYPLGAEAVFSFGNFFKKLVGQRYGEKVIFNMKLYQVVMILFFFSVFFISYIIVRFLVRFIIFKIFVDPKVADIIYKVIMAVFLVLYSIWNLIFVPALQLTSDVLYILKNLLSVLLIISFTNLTLYFVEIWFRVMIRKEPIDTMTAKKGAFTFAVAIVKGIVIIIGAFFVVESLGFNIAGLLTGISIGGFAFALGAQETIKNFFGSIMIFLDKPFQVGDWVSVNKEEGVVEEVGLRTTKIRTFYNSVVIIPNSQVANITIDNFEKRNFRRFKTYLKFPLDTDIIVLEQFIKDVENLIKKHPTTRKDFFQVKINNIGMYSIDVLLYVFFRVPNWSTELESRQEIIISVMKLANERGLKFALPPNVSV